MNKLFYSYAFLVSVLVLSSCGAPATATEVQVAATEESVMTEMPMTMEMPTEVVTEAPTDVPEESGPAPLEGEVFIDIVGTQFQQGSVTIRVGTTVTWTNKSDNEHTVTSDDGAFNSSLTDGGTFSFTFTEAGEFPYHCNIHRSMKAKIIVVE